MADEVAERVRAGYEALARGDLETVLAMVASDVEGDMIMERFHGRDAFARYLRALPWDAMAIEPLEVRSVDDRVLVILNLTGRGEGSAVPVGGTLAHLWTIREGLGVRIRSFRDPREAEAAAAGS